MSTRMKALVVGLAGTSFVLAGSALLLVVFVILGDSKVPTVEGEPTYVPGLMPGWGVPHGGPPGNGPSNSSNPQVPGYSGPDYDEQRRKDCQKARRLAGQMPSMVACN